MLRMTMRCDDFDVDKWHWDEMMLMLIMTLGWDVVDVENVIVMMYVVYVHGGVVTKLDILGGGNRVVKKFKHFWSEGMT